jgi:hypothetical protein
MDDTIFNYIDSVLFTKKKLNNLNEGETQFNLFMVNRWCSMYSPDIAEIINQTSNQYKELHALKQDQYDFCLNLFPKVRKKKLDYIKKQKQEKPIENTDYKILAKNLEISERESKEYIDFIQQLSN